MSYVDWVIDFSQTFTKTLFLNERQVAKFLGDYTKTEHPNGIVIGIIKGFKILSKRVKIAHHYGGLNFPPYQIRQITNLLFVLEINL